METQRSPHPSGLIGAFEAPDYSKIVFPKHARTMWDFGALLPVSRELAVSLGEGMTPLVRERSGFAADVHWKVEGCNPTGSQKDRALSISISKAKELGFRNVVIASTGSAGLSCAAYCARAGLACVVLVPRGTRPERLAPMQMLGATVIEVDGTFTDIESWLEKSHGKMDCFDATTKGTTSGFHFHGPKTISYEMYLDLGRAPDWVVVPVGGGATLCGIHQGFCDLKALGLIAQVPRIAAIVSDRFNALELAFKANAPEAELDRYTRDESVATVMSNLKHGVPPDGQLALRAVRESGGIVAPVTDEEALDWQGRLGRDEGIFCEPSSAAAAAGVAGLHERRLIGRNESAAALLTGSGLRETARTQEGARHLVKPGGEIDALFARNLSA